MINVLIYTEKEEDVILLRNIMKEEASKMSIIEWNLKFFHKLDVLDEHMKNHPLIDVLFMDINKEASVSWLQNTREWYGSAYLILMAKREVNPEKYIRPMILPSSIVIRPFDQDRIRHVIWEIYNVLYDSIQKNNMEDVLIISTKQGKTRLPYSQVYYFEAVSKKIKAAMETEDYFFYDTIIRLDHKLEDNFIRCHRSFLVNKSKIQKVYLSERIIALKNGSKVPISKNYRGEISKHIFDFSIVL